MNADVIYVLNLIGLRALAEFDPIEFKRSTSFSKYQIEQKIESLLESFKEQEPTWLYEEFRNIKKNVESQDEINFLLKRIYLMAFQEAQHLSLTFERENINYSNSEQILFPNGISEYKDDSIILEHDSFLKLAVMRLLKEFRDYIPLFNYKVKNYEFDCLLESKVKGLPTIIIEGKKVIRTSKQLQEAFNQLNKYINFCGKDTIGLLLTQENKTIHTYFINDNKDKQKNVYLFLFNYEKNQLHGDDFHRFKEQFIDYNSNDENLRF